jgi:hypothetical protein
MKTHLSIGLGATVLLLSGVGAAWADEPVRCTTDSLGAETCRYADGTTTRRSVDKLGYETNGRGRVVERCHSDDKGHTMCRRGPP